jgi:hypothetical protein
LESLTLSAPCRLTDIALPFSQQGRSHIRSDGKSKQTLP